MDTKDIVDVSVETAVKLLLETAKKINHECYQDISNDCDMILDHFNKHKKTPTLN